MAEKALIKVLDTGVDIPVMFNPKDYTFSSTGVVTGEGAQLQFQRVNVDDFTVTLFYDTYEKQTDVREKIQELTALVTPTVAGQSTRQPPVCLFVWGGFGYKGIIHKITQKFSMFLSSGIPVRADITLVFKSIVTREEDAQFRGREACRKLWTVKTGDRLDLIAQNALKDPKQWRKIALANRINNPLIFPGEQDIGRILIIPD
ncbi:MAG: LysM peptidoglycan-binding domain-containing protein [Desulfobacteraceae bacterium]|nr:MAG: LysM peptidoglycan-binding domain-containing protein [Desulfobacteraceae bacterium]